MDELPVGILKRILKYLVIPLILAAVVWGLVTRDPQKGADLYMNGVKFISMPIIDKFKAKAERAINRALQVATSTAQR
jgi:hypothetical protein